MNKYILEVTEKHQTYTFHSHQSFTQMNETQNKKQNLHVSSHCHVMAIQSSLSMHLVKLKSIEGGNGGKKERKENRKSITKYAKFCQNRADALQSFKHHTNASFADHCVYPVYSDPNVRPCCFSVFYHSELVWPFFFCLFFFNV